MRKETTSFLASLVVFAAILFAIHLYLIAQFFEGVLYFPIYTIYAFNLIVVGVVYLIISHKIRKGAKSIYGTFLVSTLIKMILAIVFLLPLFFGKSEHSQLEVINFFIPYFFFLGFEVFWLNKFLQKT